MELGSHLFAVRKKSGLSQEAVAEQLGVTRQTISKWETGETVPDLCQAKRLAQLYKVTLDALIDFDVKMQEIQDAIDRSDPEQDAKINWTSAWSRKYPILAQYQAQVEISRYASGLRRMLDDLAQCYQLSSTDAMLVLKDILYHEWKNHRLNTLQVGSRSGNGRN